MFRTNNFRPILPMLPKCIAQNSAETRFSRTLGLEHRGVVLLEKVRHLFQFQPMGRGNTPKVSNSFSETTYNCILMRASEANPERSLMKSLVDVALFNFEFRGAYIWICRTKVHRQARHPRGNHTPYEKGCTLFCVVPLSILPFRINITT